MKITAFLPCRKGSQRVPRKNIKPFAHISNGLVELKLNQLLECNKIDEVVLSTNDEDILMFARTIDDAKLTIHVRDDSLCTSETSTDDLVCHALELIPEGHILWTHTTSPFVNADEYSKAIDAYLNALEGGYDSLMSTTLIRGFLWDENAPINYDRAKEKWPRTQTISPIHEVNSAIFLNSATNYAAFNDRIGAKPLLYPMDKIIAHDIDWPEDFVIAESLVNSNLVNL